jgi:hypothetical protein
MDFLSESLEPRGKDRGSYLELHTKRECRRPRGAAQEEERRRSGGNSVA